eukprot:scaffold4598_cov73-Cyclotella_meneghiniana.AAC.13
MPNNEQINYVKCCQDGAIGGIGAIPGTFCAHFCDVIKMRQQLTGERMQHAITSIYRGINGNTKNNSAVKNSKSISHFFAGSMPAIQQKVTTRSTMFLTSSISVQFFEHQFGWNATSSAFIGSATSGYITGFIASPWEWQKVLVSQQVRSPSTGLGMVSLFSEAKKHHGIVRGILVGCMGRRMHAAGVRNAIFDSTFFGTKHILEDYNVAERPIPSSGVMRHTFHILARKGRKTFRGLGVKSVEFGISYMITGWMAPYVTNAIDVIFDNKKPALN